MAYTASRQLVSSVRPGSNENVSPPSYVSHTEMESHGPPGPSFGLTTPRREDINRAIISPGRTVAGTFISDQHNRAGDISRGSIRLLKLHLEQMTALTQCSSDFEEIERSARRLFRIEDLTALNISADIPSFDNERMTIDPEIWRVVSGDISAVWITLSFKPKRHPTPAAETHTIEVHIANRYAKVHIFQVQISRNATIGDLKRAITKRKSRYQVVDLVAQTSLQGPDAGSDVLDESLAYRGRYNFLYDELAFVAHLREETANQQKRESVSSNRTSGRRSDSNRLTRRETARPA